MSLAYNQQKMTFDFVDKIPQDLIHIAPILISGIDSLEFNGREYVVVNDNEKSIFEIAYEYHCSPFKEAMIVDDILAVGHEEHFYLFDLTTKTNILKLKMDGYFGHLYINNDKFYVADAAGLCCIDKSGTVIWRNNNLAMDGVIINHFVEDKILGNGEWDPPGGWRDFILDEKTGGLIE